MSILLDALKKSEEQRQLGKTPDVHAPADHDPDKGRARAPAWVPFAMMAVAAILVFWFTWAQYREPEATAVSGEPVVAKREPGLSAARPAAEARAGAPARTPVERFTAPEQRPERPRQQPVQESWL